MPPIARTAIIGGIIAIIVDYFLGPQLRSMLGGTS